MPIRVYPSKLFEGLPMIYFRNTKAEHKSIEKSAGFSGVSFIIDLVIVEMVNS